MKIAYIVPGPATDWIMTEIKALMRKGLKPLICIYDWTQEEKTEDRASIVSATLLGYIRANILFFLKYRIGYLRLAWTAKSKMGWGLFFRMIYFAGFLERERIDHIHAHFAATPAYMAKVISELIGCSFSFTAHAYDIFMNDVDRDELCDKMLLASFVRTVSQYHKEFLKSICPDVEPSKIKVITYGVDCSDFHPMEIERSGRFVLLTVSDLVRKKGFSYLIQACGKLKSQIPDFLCYIVGDGPLRGDLEAQINRMGLSDTVQLIGWISHREVNAWFSRCDVFTLPCVVTKDGNRDGIPNVLIEAMAAGVPVISTDVAGIPELIEHQRTGLVVPQRDADALAKAVEILANDRAFRLALGRSGRKKVEEEFNIEKIADQLIRVFREACQNRKA